MTQMTRAELIRHDKLIRDQYSEMLTNLDKVFRIAEEVTVNDVPVAFDKPRMEKHLKKVLRQWKMECREKRYLDYLFPAPDLTTE